MNGGGAPGPEPPPQRTALVLSGGGAKGAFEVGVLLALAEGRSRATDFRPLEVDVYTGTSVGAFNATYLASRCARGMPDNAHDLATVWRERLAELPTRCGNGVFRLRLSPFDLLDPGCLARPLRLAARYASDGARVAADVARRGTAVLGGPPDRRIEDRLVDSIDLTPFFSNQPLSRLLPQIIDLDDLRTTACQLAVIASNFRTGAVALFDQHAIADRVGFDSILASTAIPGLFPAVDIEGDPHVDGGLLMNTPLKPAIEMGANVFHVVYLDPALSKIPMPAMPSTVETIYRATAILMADHMSADISIAARINQLVELRRAAGEETEYRPLTIHRFRPTGDLGGAEGLLDFRPTSIETWIEEGYRVAVEHDCSDDGCILPSTADADASPAERGFWHPATWLEEMG